MDRTSTETNHRPDYDPPEAGAQLGLFTGPGSTVLPLAAEIDLRVEEDLLGMYYIG